MLWFSSEKLRHFFDAGLGGEGKQCLAQQGGVKKSPPLLRAERWDPVETRVTLVQHHPFNCGQPRGLWKVVLTYIMSFREIFFYSLKTLTCQRANLGREKEGDKEGRGDAGQGQMRCWKRWLGAGGAPGQSCIQDLPHRHPGHRWRHPARAARRALALLSDTWSSSWSRKEPTW